MSSKNTNKLNIPEAKAAMDKFKMEAASEEDVYPPQRIFPTLDFWLKYRENRLSRKNQFLSGNILFETSVSLSWTFVTFLPQKRPHHDPYLPAPGAGCLPKLPR